MESNATYPIARWPFVQLITKQSMTEDEGNRPEAFPKLGIIAIILKKNQRYSTLFFDLRNLSESEEIDPMKLTL